MTDNSVACPRTDVHSPHRVDYDDFHVRDCPGVFPDLPAGPAPAALPDTPPPHPLCRAEDRSPAGLRTLVCQLDAGHTGDHVETDTGMTWPSTAPPRMALAQPRTVVICGQLPLTPLVVAPRPTDRPCVLSGGHTGGHEADDGVRWFDESDAELLTAGLTAEQDIRARALHEATVVVAEMGMDADYDDACDNILEYAERFAAYITTGARMAEHDDATHAYLSTSCWHEANTTDPDEAARLHGFCACTVRIDGGNKSPARCKFCPAPCICPQHEAADATSTVEVP